jgi:hypothetical protein
MCPTTNEWIKKIVVYIYMMEYYSAISRNEIVIYGKMELEIIMLRKFS